MVRKRWRLIISLVAFGAIATSWITSYIPSSSNYPYRGWWINRTIGKHHNLGLRAGDGAMVFWYLKDGQTSNYPNQRDVNLELVQLVSGTSACAFEGRAGVPWDVLNPMNAAFVHGWVIRASFLLLPLALVPLPFVYLRYRRARRFKGNQCLNCGYSLRGLPQPRCPECGTGF